MLKDRVISGFLGAGLVLLVMYSGPVPFLLLALAASVTGVIEYIGLWESKGYYPIRWLAIAGTVIFLLLAYAFGSHYYDVFITFFILVSLAVDILSKNKHRFVDMLISVFGCLYIGLLFSYLVLIRNLPEAMVYLALVFGGTWFCDIFAYFVGMKFGSRKLIPAVSPNKTVEGALGGICGSILAVSTVGIVAGISPVHFIPLGMAIALAAQLGDLAESSLKRYTGVKDSGSLIPGHGGILDRCDSLIFAAPVVYYYIQILILPM